jgi:hypothetical protein
VTEEQIVWRLFVVFHLVTLLILGALDQWAAWGLGVLGSAVYTVVRLRWIPW